MSKLKGQATNDKGELTVKGRYLSMVSQKLDQLWKGEDTAEKKWEAVKVALCEAAESALGTENKRSPDWLRDSKIELSLLFENRNKLYKRWLCTGRESDKKKFQKACKDARRATREAKNYWFQQKVSNK